MPINKETMEELPFKNEFIMDGKFRIVDREDSCLQLTWNRRRGSRIHFETVNLDQESVIKIAKIAMEMFPEQFSETENPYLLHGDELERAVAARKQGS